jgi:hypothetical protein
VYMCFSTLEAFLGSKAPQIINPGLVDVLILLRTLQ